jgi:hypothetical protein
MGKNPTQPNEMLLRAIKGSIPLFVFFIKKIETDFHESCICGREPVE